MNSSGLKSILALAIENKLFPFVFYPYFYPTNEALMIPFFNHRKIYYWCLVLILVSLPLSLFALSVGMISLTVNWILEGHFKTKWTQLKKTPALYIFFLIYLLHLVGLIYSS